MFLANFRRDPLFFLFSYLFTYRRTSTLQLQTCPDWMLDHCWRGHLFCLPASVGQHVVPCSVHKKYSGRSCHLVVCVSRIPHNAPLPIRCIRFLLSHMAADKGCICLREFAHHLRYPGLGVWFKGLLAVEKAFLTVHVCVMCSQ